MTWRFVLGPTIRCLAHPGSSSLAHLGPGRFLFKDRVTFGSKLGGSGSCQGTGPVGPGSTEIVDLRAVGPCRQGLQDYSLRCHDGSGIESRWCELGGRFFGPEM